MRGAAAILAALHLTPELPGIAFDVHTGRHGNAFGHRIGGRQRGARCHDEFPPRLHRVLERALEALGLDRLGPGDVVVATELEHHSNFVPWQQIAKRTGATFRPIPVDGRGELQLDALDAIARQGSVKVVANNLVSNALGTINPVEKLAAWAHE